MQKKVTAAEINKVRKAITEFLGTPIASTATVYEDWNGMDQVVTLDVSYLDSQYDWADRFALWASANGIKFGQAQVCAKNYFQLLIYKF